MKLKDVLNLFVVNLNARSLNVLINRKTAELLLNRGFKVIKLGACNYEVQRREN
jgi:hypothetical protein